MRTLSTTSLALALGLLVSVACGDDDVDSDTDTDTDADTDTDSDTDSDTEYVPCEPEGNDVYSTDLHGIITIDDTEVVGCMRVQLCHGGQCVPGYSSGVGSFYVEAQTDGWGGFEMFPLTHDYGDVPVMGVALNTTTSETADISFNAVRFANLLELPATATPTDLGGGLTVTIGRDVVELSYLAPNEWLAAAQADMAAPMPIHLTGTPVMMWHLSPWDAHSEAGMDFKVADWGLDSSHTYEFYEFLVEAEAYDWVKVGDASTDGTWLTATGKLHYMTTLVLMDVTE